MRERGSRDGLLGEECGGGAALDMKGENEGRR